MFVHDDFPSLGFDDRILPNPLNHLPASPLCSLPSLLPEYNMDVPIDNPMICDATMDLGYGDNIFYMLGGNVDGYVSLRLMWRLLPVH